MGQGCIKKFLSYPFCLSAFFGISMEFFFFKKKEILFLFYFVLFRIFEFFI